MGAPLLKDTDWVRRAFMLPSHAISVVDVRRDVFRDVAFKFTDTTLGGNFAINPLPQFTRYADLKIKGRYSVSEGMGRFYSEAFDDNQFLIHIGCGVPSFTSLTTFFNEFYNPEASALARTGRGIGIGYTLGRALGFVVTAYVWPLIVAGKVARILFGAPSSKYYSLKPTMPLYWRAVNTIANSIAVNMGIVPRILDKTDKLNSELDPVYSKEDIEAYRRMLPDLYRKDGGIDIYALANRAQRLANRYRRRMKEELESASSFEDLRARIRSFLNEPMVLPDGSSVSKVTGKSEFDVENYIEAWESLDISKPLSDNESGEESSDKWYRPIQSFLDFLEADIKDGSRFVTFRVNGAGEVGESFSNQTRESDLASSINAMSAGSRSARFSFAGGNITGGVIGRTIQAVVGSISDVATGIIDQIGISGIAALAGSAFADIPEHWENSVASLPASSYTIELRSPYGNKMSRFMNLYVPLSMLLAMSLPLSTGKHSYTSPFLIELYAKGRNQIRLGIVDSLEIRRGVGNLGWTAEGEPLGIDVTISFKDLSSVVHVPLAQGQGFFDDDNTFSDYMATLGSLSLVDQVYSTRKLALNATKVLTNFKSNWLSPAAHASTFMSSIPARIANALARISETPKGNPNFDTGNSNSSGGSN